ncbi:LysR substrate-binding domain-containing protein [Roseomonas haemaphysalidis]|uniref:LysR family transcriptional regulator n=2 Tax=Roseomonas haemaphysalidis TaxID=2768162 RepID=A0ABS3KKT1_9PROT|nr:LysR substrate-binding domain-containing protein [Roseomonas haemaphysalidis]MBO1078067.1 LysR family transcriptional regulator [Roseomonas haemaphysalidis]
MAGRLTWRQIEAFRAVMLRGSVSGAAQLMNLTQPAVSRLVRDMEQTLRLQLFDRQGGQVIPNAEAILLQQEVAMSFISLGRIERTAQDLRRARRGSLRVSAMAGPALSFLPPLIARFAAEHPDTFVSIHNNVGMTTLERVSLRQFDIGMAYTPGAYPGVEIEPVPGLEALCAVPAGHALAAREVVTLQDLRDQPLLSLGHASRIGVRLDALLEVAGIQAPVVAEATASEVLCSLVAEGMGIAVIDPFTGAAVRQDRLRVLRFEPSIPYEVAMAFPAAVPRSRPVDRLAGMIRDSATMPVLLQQMDRNRLS